MKTIAGQSYCFFAVTCWLFPAPCFLLRPRSPETPGRATREDFRLVAWPRAAEFPAHRAERPGPERGVPGRDEFLRAAAQERLFPPGFHVRAPWCRARVRVPGHWK